MDKPVSPCREDCPDRHENCHNESCPHGWADYERKKLAMDREGPCRDRGGLYWTGGPMTEARRMGQIRELRRKKRRPGR